jgi:two-component system, OmpR family, response regulator CpxR
MTPASASQATRAILLIDDDAELCALLEEYLSGNDYRVSLAHDGSAGLRGALSGEYDLVVLDVMLPLLDGFEILRQLRRRSSVPVIMLTSRTAEADRISGLEHGADDYLVKPFAAGELLARLRAVLRRSEQTMVLGGSADVRVGPVRLRPNAQEAWCGERALVLTPTEFAILELLLRSAGRIVSRNEISAVLHQRQATAYERAVDVHVSHVRRKLEPEAASLIRTVRGIGYLFVLGE